MSETNNVKTIQVPIELLDGNAVLLRSWMSGAKYALETQSHTPKLTGQVDFTKEELQFIAEIMGMIGGCPESTDRKYQKTITKKLSNSGFKSTDGYHRIHCGGTSIRFKNVD